MRVDRAHHRGVEQLAAGDRDARLDDRDRRAHGVLGGREGAHGGGDRFGDRPQPQRQLGDDPERPLRADEQVGEVVAGARLSRARAGADDAPVRQHHLEREDVLAHRAVADRVGPRGAGGRHAAERRVRSRVDREERAVAAHALLQRRARDAGLHGGVEVLDAHAQDRVHQAGVQRDAALYGEDLALDRGAGAERDDGHAVLGARGTTAATSSVERGNATASGRAGGNTDSSRPWRSRTESDVDRRSPSSAPSAPIASSSFPFTAPRVVDPPP